MNSGYKQMYQTKNQRQIDSNSNQDQRAYQSISPKNTNAINYNSKSPTNMNRKSMQMQYHNTHSQKPLIQNNDFEYSQTYNIVNEMSFSSKSPSSRNKASIQIPSSQTPSTKKIPSQKSSQSQNKVPFQKYQQGKQSNQYQNQQSFPPQQAYVQQREFLNSSPINLDRFENLNVGRQSMIQKNSFQKPNWVNLKQNNNIANIPQVSQSPMSIHRSEMEEKRDYYSSNNNNNERFQNNSQQLYQLNNYSNYPKIQFSSINSVDEHQQSNFRSPEFNYAQQDYERHNVVRQIQFFDDASKENYGKLINRFLFNNFLHKKDQFKPSNSRSPQNKFSVQSNQNLHNFSAHQQQQHQNSVNNQKHVKSEYVNNSNYSNNQSNAQQYQSKNNGFGIKIQQNMLFRESDNLLKEVCQENEYFNDEQTTYQVNTIISTIQKEKQIIMNDMNYLLCQVKKYKGLCSKQNLDSKQEDSDSKTEDQSSHSNEQLAKPQKQQKELSQDQQQQQQNQSENKPSKKELSFLQDSSICLDPKQKAVNQLLNKWVSEDADGCLTFEADSSQEILQSNAKQVQDLENFTLLEENEQNQKNQRQNDKEIKFRNQEQRQFDKQNKQEQQQEEEEYMPQNETYLKMAHLLSEMNVDPSLILPNPSNVPSNNEVIKDIDDKSIIEIQKLIIKKLINKVEEGREMNNILIQKMKFMQQS